MIPVIKDLLQRLFFPAQPFPIIGAVVHGHLYGILQFANGILLDVLPRQLCFVFQSQLARGPPV